MLKKGTPGGDKQTGEAPIVSCSDHNMAPLEFYCDRHTKYYCASCSCFADCPPRITVSEHNEEVISALGNCLNQLAEEHKQVHACVMVNEEFGKQLESLKKDRKQMIDSCIVQLTQKLNKEHERFCSRVNEVLQKVAGERDNQANNQDQLRTHTEENRGWVRKLEDAKQRLEAANNTTEAVIHALPTLIKGHEFQSAQERFKANLDPRFAEQIKLDIRNLKGTKGLLEELMQRSESESENKGKPIRPLYSPVSGCSDLLTFSQKNMKGALAGQCSGTFPHFCALAARQESVYVTGGTVDYVTHLKDAVSFDIPSKTNTRLPDPTEARSQHCAAVLQGFLLVVGGLSDKGMTSNAELYDMLQKKWNTVWGSPKIRLAAITVSNDRTKAYLFGGANQTEAENTLQMFNIATSRWEKLSTSPALPALYSAGLLCLASGSEEGKEPTLIIFGGVEKLGAEPSNKVYEVAKRTVNESNLMAFPDTFYGQQAELSEGGLMCIGKQYLHIKDKEAWKTIPNPQWQPLK
jgi:hypothetical protein